MKRNMWKKILIACFVVGALVFSFWYGGDAPGLRGFSINSEETENEEAGNDDQSVTGSENPKDNPDNADKKSQVETKSDSNAPALNDGKATSTIKSHSGFSFSNIVMKIKRIGTTKRNARRNPQLNKKATKNANKAVARSRKKKTSKTNKNSGTNASKTNNSKTDNSKDKAVSDNDSDNATADKTAKEQTNSDASLEKDGDNKTAASKGETSQKEASQEGKAAGNTTQSDIAAKKDDNENYIYCTISISCTNVLKYMDKLTDATRKVIPESGIMLDTTTVKVKKDSTVFDVLQKAARDNGIHLEYNYTPAYKTYYIEGIGNLYQFDAGNLSGWMYSVNDEFPGVGCSGCKVNDGDVIKWVYTCSYGKDVQ